MIVYALPWLLTIPPKQRLRERCGAGMGLREDRPLRSDVKPNVGACESTRRAYMKYMPVILFRAGVCRRGLASIPPRCWFLYIVTLVYTKV